MNSVAELKKLIDEKKPLRVIWLYRWENPPENVVPASYLMLAANANVSVSGSRNTFASFYSADSGNFLFQRLLDQMGEYAIEDGVLVIDKSKFSKAYPQQVIEYEQFMGNKKPGAK